MIKAEIVAHSLSPQGDELISVLCTFPRIILAEVNTHRMLSKNTSSSRAIPFKKMVESVQNNPFIPIAWQKDHKGMQGSEYITDDRKYENSRYDWLKARNLAVQQAKLLNENDGVTKQLCNRLLEPFMWTTMLITGSREGWDNFFNLRCPQYKGSFSENIYKSRKEASKSPYNEFNNFGELDWLNANKGQAEIHIMDLAEKIYDAMNESTPEQLKAGQWHIPFEDKIRTLNIPESVINPYFEMGIEPHKAVSQILVKISTAMAAHTSYTIVGGEAVKSCEKWIELHDKLVAYDPPHSSPLEHCARAMSEVEYTASKSTGYTRKGEDQYGWCNNLKGFIPYRYMIDNNLI